MTTPEPETTPPQPAPQPDPGVGELVELERASVTVARFADYAGAQQAVDYLSDNGFPVEKTAIIGTDLRLVENVLGRLTIGRAALAGVASGAWFGLFIGILFTLFSDANWVGILLSTILIGAVWGAIFGAAGHALTGGRRDFSSRSSLQAGQYAVTVQAEAAEEARVLITRQNWRAANPNS
ncbi:general stress protein [Dactylosporangium sp. NPDC051541]|uniref:general stress protein n=1 Tax=Dactylosporangium sp. NPDC051541 TaxID=3363977 RepID=UPI0037949230